MPQESAVFTDGCMVYSGRARTPSMSQQLDEWTRRRVRCFIWKQWKTRRHRAQELVKAGIGPWLAWGTVYDGPSLWRAAGRPALHGPLATPG